MSMPVRQKKKRLIDPLSFPILNNYAYNVNIIIFFLEYIQFLILEQHA